MGFSTKDGMDTMMAAAAAGQGTQRNRELAEALYEQFQQFHSKQYRPQKDIEQLIIKQKQHELEHPNWFKADVLIFSPSSVAKCPRELFFKALKAHKDEQQMQPYQKRWVRNSTAVHEAVQRDFLYMEKLMDKPAFTVKRDSAGLPLWEKASASIKHFEHNGQKFAVAGMMDGILQYRKDKSTVGFEFKTKTNSLAQISNFRLKEPADYHVLQTVGYSLIFDITEFIIMYEAVVKDTWAKGAEAKTDIKTFSNTVTEQDRYSILDKLAAVTAAVKAEELPPPDTSKCMMCEFKTICGGKL